MSNLIIDKIRTKAGDAYINYNTLANKPELAPLEVTFTNTDNSLVLSADYATIKAAFLAGRQVYLKDENNNLYFPTKKADEEYEFIYITQNQSYNKIKIGAGTASLMTQDFIVNLILKYNSAGEAQNSNWEKYIVAPEKYEPLLLNVETQEQYLFKENDNTQFTFFTFGYNADLGTIIYKEAILAQDGTVTFQTKDISGGSSANYQGTNGVKIENSNVGLEYGLPQIVEGQEFPYVISTAPAAENIGSFSYDSGNDIQIPFSKNIPIKIYGLQNGIKTLVEDSPVYYWDNGGGVAYVGVNINETPYSADTGVISSYTIKDSSLPIHGIAQFHIDVEHLGYKGFSSTEAATLIITGPVETSQYIPERMEKWGKWRSSFLDLTKTLEEISQINDEGLEYLPQLALYNWHNIDNTSFYIDKPDYEKNSTLDINFLYDVDALRIFSDQSSTDTVVTLETSSDSVNNYFKSILETTTNYYPYRVQGGEKTFALSSLITNLQSLRYYKINISSSLEEIVLNKTWTPTDESLSSVLLILVTTTSGIQVWVPLTLDSSTDLSVVFLGMKRPFQTKSEIPASWLHFLNNGSFVSLSSVFNDESLLNSFQIQSLIQSSGSDIIVEDTITQGSSNPISSGAVYTLAEMVNNSATQSYVDDKIASAIVDYETQVTNKPTLPTAASIQAEMAYDTTPTENSSNLIKSGDLYTVQQSIVESINGKTKGYVFDTNSELQAWLTDENKAKLKIGDVLYIKETGYPDFWWDGTNTQYLETQKIDLTDYYTKQETSNLYALKTSLDNLQTIADRDVYVTIKTATLAESVSIQEKNICVEATTSEGNWSAHGFEDAGENELHLTILKIYNANNTTTPFIIFSFNHRNSLHKSFLSFLPDDAPVGTYYGSDILPMTYPKSSGLTDEQFFLQAWLYHSDTTPKIYIKRTDYSTQQIEIVSALPSSPDANTLYFVTS